MKNKYFIGIDIGGTRTKIILRSNDDAIIKQKIIDSNKNVSGLIFFDLILKSIIFLLKKENISNSQLLGIGVGVPGIFDKSGKVINLPNFQSLNELNFRKLLSNEFDLKINQIKICNDAQTSFYFFKDELKKRKEKNVAFLTLGTSVGCCLVLNGKHYVGAGLASQLAGSYFISNSKNKRIDNIMSIKFILSESSRLGLKIDDFNDFKVALKSRDKIALSVFETYGKNLSIVFRNLFQILHLDKIYILGGLSNYKKYFLPVALENFKINGGSMGVCEIEVLKSKYEIGAIGASKMFK